MKKYIVFGLILASFMIIWSLLIAPRLLDDHTFSRHTWHAFILWPIVGQIIGYVLYRIDVKKRGKVV